MWLRYCSLLLLVFLMQRQMRYASRQKQKAKSKTESQKESESQKETESEKQSESQKETESEKQTEIAEKKRRAKSRSESQKETESEKQSESQKKRRVRSKANPRKSLNPKRDRNESRRGESSGGAKYGDFFCEKLSSDKRCQSRFQQYLECDRTAKKRDYMFHGLIQQPFIRMCMLIVNRKTGNLREQKYSDYSKLIMALTSIGIDAQECRRTQFIRLSFRL